MSKCQEKEQISATKEITAAHCQATEKCLQKEYRGIFSKSNTQKATLKLPALLSTANSWLQPLTHPAQSDLDPKQKPLKEIMSCLKFCWLQNAVSFSLSKINASLLEQIQSNKNPCTDMLGREEDRFSLADGFNTCDPLLRAMASRPAFLSSGSDLGGICDQGTIPGCFPVLSGLFRDVSTSLSSSALLTIYF